MKPLHFVLTFFCLLFICSVTSAQNNGYYHGLKTATSGNSGTGANIDVVYHRLSLAISPEDATKTLTGSTVTYFKTTVSAVNSLSFDLSKTSFNNTNLSVFYHGISCSYSFPTTGNTNILNITLPSSIANIETLDSITINYKGTPASPSGQKLGLARSYDNAGNYYIFTLSESYEDRNWWPCKADMQDKIDSLDIICTVPSAYWVAANGLMTDSSIVGSNRVFTFKHSYPIASYLVAFAAAKYKKIYLGNVTVGSKNVPFVANIFPDKTTTTENTIINYLNSNKQVFSTFNTLYGNYPFANEKHGFYEFGFGGGMEHQTFSGLDASSFQSHSVMAHELAHQWFGDKVTMATWNHLWLAEGFATYSETVAAEKIPSLGLNYASLLLSSKTSARANTSTSIYLTSIANSDSVWSSKNTTAVYDRGCMVASMLRCLLGENKFFTACKNYLSDTNLQYKSATTSDLQLHMETQFGESMNDFFNEWIMKKGTPNYTVSWAKQTKYIVLGLTQSVTSSGTTGTASTFFPMPVAIKIVDTINHLDTTVIIYHKSANVLMTSGDGVGTTYNSNFIGYNLSFTPNKVIFDSLNQTMANATIIYNASLPLYSVELKNTSTKNGNNLTALISTDELVDAVELWKSTSRNDFVSIGNMTLQNKNATSFQFGFIDKHITNSCFYKAVFHTKNGLIVYSKIIFVDSKQNNALVYPNPAKTFFSIQLKQLSNKTIYKLYDASGKLVDTKTILEMASQISTSHLTNGIYWLEIEMNDNIISSQKIIVEK